MGQVDRASGAVAAVAMAALSASHFLDDIEPVLLVMLSVLGADIAGLYQQEESGWTRPVLVLPAEARSRIPFPGLVQTVAAIHLQPDLGRSFQFAIPISSELPRRTCWLWGFGRIQNDFTSGDRELAHAVLPVLRLITHQYAAVHASGGGIADTALLTPRELLVLRLLASGLRPVQISQRLGISPRTVNKHSERIYRKLSVADRFHAIAVAADLKLLPT